MLHVEVTPSAKFNNSIDIKADSISESIDQIIWQALKINASDIHFEPYQHEYRVRLRCDGVLSTHMIMPTHLQQQFSACLKVMAKLNIAEKRMPQDGRLLWEYKNQQLNIRLSTITTQWGEKVVLRLLPYYKKPLTLTQLGFTSDHQLQYQHALQQPQGLILVTGPTGSGKTTTLYSGLHTLNTQQRNICTIEDPIEINLNGINQVAINEQIGMSFPYVLRAFLRQDPDVIMVGEIRDKPTAEIAITAAQTGHLVLSTLHTNSALETLQRLQNIGIENYLLHSSITLIIAQRLIRCLCPHCKVIDNSLETITALKRHITSKQTVYAANTKGCMHCRQGYIGRTVIYELLPFNSEIKHKLFTIPSEDISYQSLHISTLYQNGLQRVLNGQTSLDELNRISVSAE